MKTLLLDAGNSRLKWAFCEQGQLSLQGALGYEWSTLADQLDAELGSLVSAEWPLAGVILCNVVGEKLEAAVRAMLSIQECKRQPHDRVQERASLTIKKVVAQPAAFGVRCAYEQPAQLGADRWAALVAARHHCDGVSCVIDCGTALTLDVLTAEGRHAGGMIIPGMEMMLASLIENTHGILASKRPELSPFAVRNTADAVQAGIIAAMRGSVQQMLQYCRDELGVEPICVLTGGNANWLLPGLPDTALLEPDWVLKGLAIIADENRVSSIGTRHTGNHV